MENLLCEYSDLDTTNVFLADFGFVNFFDDVGNECMDSLIGTPAYVAPEIIAKKPYSAAVDLYALGMMVCRMLCGEYPYDTREGMGATALQRPLEYTNNIWPTLSEHPRNMIRGLL
ncbi:Serine/threonine-protein kinase H2 [Gracilariopsis chorda]|uniref:Serine/threonine-protein kinase H2 n=1 Tax=Gracilariopsis chorda TaxID=448386 RepID=A0A2V3IRC9_9FLOR|nr:Serine/threonine-protein kinase H2 [Gracilariopsis chorda]|eukprot:PXF43710.1 Serine/threonine-protein kinase H2 [Gracilariopsis chorda]